MRKIIVFLSIILALASMQAQGAKPVEWTVTADNISANSAVVTLTARIEKGWYLYGLSLPQDGPHATQIDFELPDGVTADGPLTPSAEPSEKYDPIFSLKLSRWESDVEFTQKLSIAPGHSYGIGIKIIWQACNGETCTPPQRETFSVTAGSGTAALPSDTTADEEPQNAGHTAVSHAPDTPDSWWEPVAADHGNGDGLADRPVPTLILWFVTACIIALLTPGARRRFHISLSAVLPQRVIGIYRPDGRANTLKVSLVFIEAAITLKLIEILATACGWHFPDRVTLLSLWAVIFLLLGLYLLGKLRFRHDKPVERLGVWRTVWAALSLAFALCLLTGLWSVRPTNSCSLPSSATTEHGALIPTGEFRQFDDYEAGMIYAAEHSRPVLLCFNSDNDLPVETLMQESPEADKLIRDNFVLITLPTDSKAKLSKPFEVKENRKEDRFTTAGEKWSWLLKHKFGTESTPYVTALDNNGEPLASPAKCDGNPDRFAGWLKDAISNYQK